MTKILSVSAMRAIKIPVNSIPQLSQVRFMSPFHTPVEKPRLNMVANLERATVKIKINTKPRNSVPFSCFSTTSTSDQIQTVSSSVAVGVGIDNPCSDIFSIINTDLFDLYDNAEAYDKRIEELLPLAWSHNPLTTLKLILNLQDYKKCWHRNFHEKAFYTAVFWLHKNHPKTLASNLASFAAGQFGSLDDLVQILNLLLEGQDVSTAIEMYERDPDYKLLHDRVSYIFVEYLKSDIQKLKKADIDDDQYCGEITKAADCCLSNNSSSMDFLCDSIASKIFPREPYPEEVEADDYANKVREQLRKEVLEPLREAFNSPGNQQRKTISLVDKYLDEVKAGKSKFAADAMLPHEIISYANHWNYGKLAEFQWKTMVEDMLNQGKMKNCMAVCDVGYLCFSEIHNMEVAVALTILMSELNEEPWKGKVISFQEDHLPELNLIPSPGDELRYKWDFVARRMMEGYIDLRKVFDIILQEAVARNLKPEQMIKKVFIFTTFTRTFDDLRGFDGEDLDNSWETEYQEIQSKYKENGYENAVPHVVFWKSIYEMRAYVMPCTKPGVTMLSGWSDNLIKYFLDNAGEFGPDFAMKAAISGEEYQKLIVVD